jgi:hypothetical protein
MRPALRSPKEYRDFAAKCFRWAARAKREEHKNMMLHMASHWLQTAEEMECSGTAGRRSTSKPPLRNRSGKRPRSSKDDREGGTTQH